MSTEFPHKSFPCAKVDPDSLARHANAADPHPGAYIRATENDLGLEHITLFYNIEQFRAIPEDKSIGYDPSFVVYLGSDATDSITGIKYTKYHPYVYQGTNKTVSGVTYPIWTDKVDEWGGNRAEAIAKALIYNHATDADTTIENVHPTLARAVHTHAYTDITDFSTAVFNVSKSIYSYVVKDVATATQRQFQDAVIIYIGEQAEYKPGQYFQKGHIYHYEMDNLYWTDITNTGGGTSTYYTKDEINLFITKHNANQAPFTHDGFSQVGHMHVVGDITNFESNVQSIVTPAITAAIADHNSDTTVHAALISDHNGDANAHAGLFAAKTPTETHIADTDIHVTSTEKTKWNNLAGIPGTNCITGKNAMPILEYIDNPVLGGESTYKIQLYPSSLNDETTIFIATSNTLYSDLAGIYLQEDYTKTGTARTYLKRGTTDIRIAYSDTSWKITGGSAATVPTLTQTSPASTSLWTDGTSTINMQSYFGYSDEENKGLLEYNVGDTIYLNLAYTSESDSDTEVLATAVIKSIDLTNCVIYVTDSLYKDPVTSSTSIGLDHTNYTYYTTTSTTTPSKQYLKWPSATTDYSIFEGKKIFIKYGSNKPEVNTITKIVAGATTSSDLVYLTTAVTGASSGNSVTAYYGTPYTYIAQNDTSNPNYCISQGESMFAAGYCSVGFGGWNVVTGMCSLVTGSMNIVSGIFDVVGGTNNSVTGSSTFVLGTGNKAADTFDIAIGDQNKLWYQSEIAIGSMNEMTGINTMAIGHNNHVKQFGSLTVGDNNTVDGKYSFVFGYSNNVYSTSSYIFGRYGNVEDLPKYKNAFVVWGGEKDDNAKAFSTHSHKSKYNTEFDIHTLTSHTKFQSGTTYYIRGTSSTPYTYIEVSMITNGAAIPASTYYTKSGSTYTEASGTFASGTTYYTKYTIGTTDNYTEAIRAGASVTSNKYYVVDTSDRTVDDLGNKKYIPAVGFRTEYKGQLTTDTDAPTVLTSSMEYEIDFERFSRVKLPANVAVTLSAKKDNTTVLDDNGLGTAYIDGDKCELIIPASTSVTFPSDWHMGSFTYQTGKFYILELEVVDNVIYLWCKYSE